MGQDTGADTAELEIVDPEQQDEQDDGISAEDLAKIPHVGEGLVREIKSGKKRAYTVWTAEGERMLEELYMAGKMPAELARVFKCSRNTVYNKIEVMGLRHRRDQLQIAVSAKLAELTATQQSKEITTSKESHAKFLSRCSMGALKLLERALTFGDQAANARDLSAAVNSAAKAAEMYRKAQGMDDGPKHGGTFNFTLVAASPLRGEREVKQAQPA